MKKKNIFNSVCVVLIWFDIIFIAFFSWNIYCALQFVGVPTSIIVLKNALKIDSYMREELLKIISIGHIDSKNFSGLGIIND